MLGTDDVSGASELSMYVGTSEADVIHGTVRPYVLEGRSVIRSGDLQRGESLIADWAEISRPASLSSVALQSTVNGLWVFAFIRLEDKEGGQPISLRIRGRCISSPANEFRGGSPRSRP